MKKIFAAGFVFIALASVCLAAALDIGGIPADVHGVVQIDFSTAQKVPSGIALLESLKKQSALPQKTIQARADFQRQTNYNPATDLVSVTFGFYKSARAEELPQVVAIVRGQFSKEKILSLVRQNKIGITQQGVYLVIAPSNLGTMLVPELGHTVCARFQSNTLACIVDKNTVIFAPTTELVSKLVAAVTNRAANYIAPKHLAQVASRVRAPYVVAHAGSRFAFDELTFLPEMPGVGESPKATSAFVALGDNAARAQVSVSFEYASADAAAKKENTVRLFRNLLPVAASSGDAHVQRAMRIFETASFSTNDKYRNISFECSVAEAQRVLAGQF